MEPVVGFTEARRQHYVSRFFLEAFAGEDGRIIVHDLQDETAFQTSATNIGLEIGFNDFEFNGMTISTETWLTEVEYAAAPLIERLRDDPDTLTKLDLQQDMLLSRFLATLLFRVPAFRAQQADVESRLVELSKGLAQKGLRGGMFGKLSEEEAATIFDSWNEQPPEWWVGQTYRLEHAELAAQMMAETQGFANLIHAKPWKIGSVPESLPMYTSDNPMAPYLTSVRPWWDHGGIMSLDYFVALSPRTLLRLGRRQTSEKEEPSPHGLRIVGDFSEWDASFARHLTSMATTRFVYGSRPVPDACATDCVTRINRARLDTAMKYAKFDPYPPQMELPE